MRLLRTSKPWTLQEFFGKSVPSYAILSHTWDDEEVTFHDMHKLEQSAMEEMNDMAQKSGSTMRGWSKIFNCCRLAASDGFEWVWIDTCCIDKSSSAELSEAINSMFACRDAKVCYVYLSDVPAGGHPTDLAKSDSHFSRAKWFTRGWTLQELLAPNTLTFFNQDWKCIGDKKELDHFISRITGIYDLEKFEKASVAQKMFWASRRETTRIEDLSYSLLGIFGINMPPMYGEGENAFQRLQLEILKISDDESLFAWTDSQDQSGGLLARSLSAFEDSDCFSSKEHDREKPPYTMTNKGLQMETYLLETRDTESLKKDPVRCYLLPLESFPPIAIQLRQIEGNQFARISSGAFFSMNDYQSKEFEKNISIRNTRTKFWIKQRKQEDVVFFGPNVVNVPSLITLEKRFALNEVYLLHPEWSLWERIAQGGVRITLDKTGQPEIGAVLRYICLETSDERILLIRIERGEFHARYTTIHSERRGESLRLLWSRYSSQHSNPDKQLCDIKEVPAGIEMNTIEHLNRVELRLDVPHYYVKMTWRGWGMCYWDIAFVT